MAELARYRAEDQTIDMSALKGRIHNHLLEQLNLELLERLEPAVVREQIATLVADRLREERVPLNAAEREQLIEEMQDEMLGLGPLEPLLADNSITEILINTCRQTYVERRGVLERSPIRFSSDAHLMRIIDKIASAVGRRVDESSPMVDARLADGSRVNAIIPPLAVDGPILSIRKFSADPYTMQDLTAFRSLTPGMAAFLEGAIRAQVNLLVSGGTGSGKTTLLNALSGYIPAAERIISIEDSAELQLQQPHVVRLETRPPNLEGKGEITQRDLVRNALRMRPDRIIVGEVRGAEAMDMLQAMNTGHDGSLSTIHANSARDALTRLEHMVGMSGASIPQPVARHQIASALQLLVNIERLIDGRRVVTSIQEITGMEEHVVTTQELFTFTREGLASDGGVAGHFRATGIRPWLLKRFRERGVHIEESIFDPERVYA